MAVVRQRWLVRGLLLAGCALLALLGIAMAVDVIAAAQICGQNICRASISSLLQSLGGVLMAALMIGFLIMNLQALRIEDRRRTLAARGNGPAVHIERVLRTATPAVLALPALLRIRMGWRTRQTGLLAFAVLVVIEAIFGVALLSLRDDPTVTPGDALGVQAILVAILLFIFGLLWFVSRERVVATDAGLSVRRSGVTRRIAWTDARLFALIGPNEFELSGPRRILRWTRPVDASSYDTVIPFDEYQRQMDGLLLLIAARTGLPLADLSQKTH